MVCVSNLTRVKAHGTRGGMEKAVETRAGERKNSGHAETAADNRGGGENARGVRVLVGRVDVGELLLSCRARVLREVRAVVRADVVALLEADHLPRRREARVLLAVRHLEHVRVLEEEHEDELVRGTCCYLKR